jgi:hypothetical protein
MAAFIVINVLLSWIAPSSSHSKPFWSLNRPTFLRAADHCVECHEPFKLKCHGPERVSWHSPTGHSPLQRWYRWWKPLRSGISDSLPRPTVSPPSPFENCLYVHSHQGLVMLDLLDNFLNPLKLFLAMTNDFPKSPWQRFGGGQVRTINGGPATANQVRDSEKELKQKLLETKSSILDILLSNLSDERSAR